MIYYVRTLCALLICIFFGLVLKHIDIHICMYVCMYISIAIHIHKTLLRLLYYSHMLSLGD